MKLSKSLLILSSAAVGLTMVTGEDGAPTKAQQILRQKMAAMDGTAKPSSGPKLPSKVELLTEVQRLHQEGKITDQQSEAFRKNINDQYAAPAGPVSTEAVARVQPGVDPKPAPPNAAVKAEKTVAPAPKPTPEPRAQAQQAPPPQTAPAPKPAATPKPTAAPPQKPVAVQPAAPTGALTPEQEAKARELLRAQIAAGAKQEKIEPVASTSDANAQAKALAILRQQQAAAQPAPFPRPIPKAAAASAPTPKPEPIPNPDAQAKALAALRQQQAAALSTPSPQPAPAVVARAPEAVAPPVSTPQPVAAPPAVAQPAAPGPQQELEAKVGIGPDTPDLTKVLRVKVAEVEGTVPRQQAEQIIAPLVAPPALSESNKQGLERLAELTDLYKANRITPAQYHQERAKVVATLNK